MDKALEKCPAIKNVLVVNRTMSQIRVDEGWPRYLWHRALDESGAEIVEPELWTPNTRVYILYTSARRVSRRHAPHHGGYLVVQPAHTSTSST